jgi:Fe-S cluster assembly protein SufD
LLLSEDAEVDTKPQLEIFADDVKCSHGATIGQLDENQVFYLRARGLSEQAARNVLTYAFCEEIIAQLPIEPLRKHLNQALLGRLPDSEQLAELI